jgi:hypothetical protein
MVKGACICPVLTLYLAMVFPGTARATAKRPRHLRLTQCK